MADIKKKKRDYGEPVADPSGGKYEKKAQGALDDYLSRGDFSYDAESDPLYQSYRNSYMRQGQEAMKDVYAEASGLTGGYGNSYAAAAGAEAYGGYLDRLNDRIPELYQGAYERYSDANDEAFRRYQAANGFYSDILDRYYNDRNFYSALDQQEYENAYNEYADEMAYNRWLEEFNYGKERDQVGDAQWQQQFDREGNQWQQQFDREGNQWQQEFDYGKQRDQVSDTQWQQQFDREGSQWQQEFDYGKQRDQVSDTQWQQQFDREGNQWQQEFDYGKQRDKVKDDQWERRYSLDRRRYLS